jgi:hypothetical protein
MKTLIPIPIVLLLASCNSTFVAKSKSGSYVAYDGSGMSKSAHEEVDIELADGTRIRKKMTGKDEVEGAATIARLGITKMAISKSIDAGKSISNNVVDSLDQ